MAVFAFYRHSSFPRAEFK